MLDAIFYSSQKRMSVAFQDSREAISLLESIASVIQGGIMNKFVQHTPHQVLLNRKFYHRELKPLMARWQLLYLRNKRLPSVDDKHLLSGNGFINIHAIRKCLANQLFIFVETCTV